MKHLFSVDAVEVRLAGRSKLTPAARNEDRHGGFAAIARSIYTRHRAAGCGFAG
jgi:hypothetical protein